MYEEIVSALQVMVESSISEINTQIPGTIISYDAEKNRAVVKPSLPRRLADDEPLPAPNIVEVPLVWASGSGGKTGLTMPVKPGDGVMLVFQQRSLEGWLDGNNKEPDDPRQFDLSDCVAIPGCASSGIVAHPDDVVLRFDKAEVRIKPDGTIALGNDKGGVTIDLDGNITLKGQSIKVDTPAKTFTLETHQHLNTKSDPTDNSGPPKPS